MLKQREKEDYQRGEDGEDGEDYRSAVAVAIEKDKASQYTLKWAIDNIVTTDHIVKLVHVNHKPNSIPTQERQRENPTMELFLPFRCYCTRRKIDCEVVLLEYQDIGKALIDYVTECGIETLVLGAAKNSKSKPITKIFKATGLPSSVLKGAPDFCNVYIISKGKVQAMRSATGPAPFIPAPARKPYSENELTFQETTMTEEASDGLACDEVSAQEADSQLPRGGHLARASRVSADGAFFAFCENLGSEPNQKSQSSEGDNNESSWSESKQADPSSLQDMSPVLHDTGSASFSSQNRGEMEDEIKRLKVELKRTMEMYYAACKEALESRRKARDIQEWKKKEVQKLQAADLAELALKTEKKKYEAAQKLYEQEEQRRVEAEMKAMKEAEEKQMLVEALGELNSVVKYKNLFHITVVLFVFYFYFTIKILLILMA